MSNISVAEILKIHGTWTESKPFAKSVSKKKGITERHAYNLIKDATGKHEILRITLPNRTVLYGLPEFGYSQKNEKKNSQPNVAKEQIIIPEESELDRAKAISLMKEFEALSGYRFSKEEWAYVLNQNNGKRILDKARALIQLRGTEALL